MKTIHKIVSMNLFFAALVIVLFFANPAVVPWLYGIVIGVNLVVNLFHKKIISIIKEMSEFKNFKRNHKTPYVMAFFYLLNLGFIIGVLHNPVLAIVYAFISIYNEYAYFQTPEELCVYE